MRSCSYAHRRLVVAILSVLYLMDAHMTCTLSLSLGGTGIATNSRIKGVSQRQLSFVYSRSPSCPTRISSRVRISGIRRPATILLATAPTRDRIEAVATSNYQLKKNETNDTVDCLICEIPIDTVEKAVALIPGSESVERILTTPLVELGICVLVLLSSLLVALGTLPKLPMAALSADRSALDAIGYIFAVEFALRWYSTGQLSIKFLAKPLSLVDIVVVVFPLLIAKVAIPFLAAVDVASTGVITDYEHPSLALQVIGLIPPWLFTSSGLVNLLLLRILRLQRVLVDAENFGYFGEALGFRRGEIRPYQLAVARVVLSIFTLLSVSTGLIYTAEHTVNPQIPDYFTALYFGLTTLTTVGFGDIVPVTSEGRLIVSGSILAGVAIIPFQAFAGQG